MDTFTVAQGIDATYRVTIRDGAGNPVTTYLGSEPLAGRVWPGNDLAAAFSLGPTWADHTAGTIDVSIAAADTQALGVGTYRLRLTLLDGPLERDLYEGALEVTASPGGALTLPVYCQYADMLLLAPWIGDLQELVRDETGFAGQRAAARTRLDNLILRSYRGQAVGQFGEHSALAFRWAHGGGNRRSVLSSPTLRTWLASNTLMVRDEITRINAHWAIADVCLAQMGRGGAYISYGAWHRREGDSLAVCTTAELDINADGVAEVGVPLGSTNTLFT
jgi:hypothetical protein